MKIVDVRVELAHEPAPQPPFHWRRGLPGSDPDRVAGWLLITTDEGVTGYGYSPRGVALNDVVERRIRDELLGADPLARELLWRRLWELDRVEEFQILIIGVVDVALWDIAGKVANLPVYRLLGEFRSEIPAYASTMTFSSIDEYLDIADQCLAAGFSAIKLHAFGDARADSRLCAALREHVGEDIDLMYDGSAAFDLNDAIYLGRALSEARYSYYEEPMREFSVTAYRALARRVDVPLLVAETSDGAHMNTADFIASGSAVAVRTSAALRGGITGAMRIAHLADAHLMRAEVHGSGLVNQHLCMAIPNNTYYESFIPANPVSREPAIGADGILRAPVGAGIGWEGQWATTGSPWDRVLV